MNTVQKGAWDKHIDIAHAAIERECSWPDDADADTIFNDAFKAADIALLEEGLDPVVAREIAQYVASLYAQS